MSGLVFGSWLLVLEEIGVIWAILFYRQEFFVPWCLGGEKRSTKKVESSFWLRVFVANPRFAQKRNCHSITYIIAVILFTKLLPIHIPLIYTNTLYTPT